MRRSRQETVDPYTAPWKPVLTAARTPAAAGGPTSAIRAFAASISSWPTEDQLGRGLGTAMVRAFVEMLFRDPSVTRVQTDPAPGNARAIRCYEKAGFRVTGEVETPDGRAVLMVCSPHHSATCGRASHSCRRGRSPRESGRNVIDTAAAYRASILRNTVSAGVSVTPKSPPRSPVEPTRRFMVALCLQAIRQREQRRR